MSVHHDAPRHEAPLADAAARDRIAGDLDATLIVEAAAGTGKTTELVRRILRAIASGRVAVSGLVAVTFTEKAAGELKLRLRQELDTARREEADDVSRARLDEALRTLESAQISTIHGFCAELLRERPVDAGIDPLFSVLTESQARRLYGEAFAAWFQRTLEDPPEGVRRSLRRPGRVSSASGPSAPSVAGVEADGPVDRLRAAGWALAEWRDFPASWSRPAFERDAVIEALGDEVHAFAALSAQATRAHDSLYADTAAARRASHELRLLGGSDGDAAEALLVELAKDRTFCRPRRGGGRTYGPEHARADVLAAHDALLQRLTAFRLDADADLAALLRDELQGSIEAYERLKARQGALDFLDLLLRARNLVRDRDEVRAAFQARYRRIFVDEFQDTDPLQAELLLLLSADDPHERDWTRVRVAPGKLFIVGDPKQSIYRFRRADVGVYHQVCERLVASGAGRLQLTTSFRSVPNLQRAINVAFAPMMTGNRETLQADYVPLHPARPDRPAQPSVVALPVPAPYGIRNVAASAIERSLPDAVGAFVDWLLTRSGWTVTERRGGAPVPVEARHVCLLFRRFVSFGTDMARPYVDAFEARGIPHLLVGGRAFHGREEIDTLRAALAAIEWPDDELSVFATLRGACFAIGDEELLEYRHRWPRGFHPFRIAPDLPDHLTPIAETLALLADLHRHRNRRPVAETVHRLLDATRAHVGFALRRAGEQVLANVLHVAELARQYELSGGLSFRGFVDELHDAADGQHAAEAPIVEEGSEGVRLMTVHKAKGLEFPVVVLADMTARLSTQDAARHIDPVRGLCALRIGGWSPHDLLVQQAIEQAREREEGIRIAYVAATRARDVLVVPAVGDDTWDAGWVSPLNGALYPPVGARRQPSSPAGCPPFRADSVLERPLDETARPQTVAPGLHRVANAAGIEACEVVWWDPAALSLGVEPPFGLRRQELIAKDVAPEVVAEGQREYIQWRETRIEALARGRQPSRRVMTVTEWVSRTSGSRQPVDEAAWVAGSPGVGIARDITSAVADGPVDIVEIGAAARPSGPRFGTLVHAALATVAFDADAAVVDAVVATQGRIVGAASDEVVAAAALVSAALRHPVLAAARRAAAAGRCWREMPVTLIRGEVLVEGVVDLAFDDGSVVTVVDFKTDRPDGALRRQYEAQVSVYARAIGDAEGRPARPLLFLV